MASPKQVVVTAANSPYTVVFPTNSGTGGDNQINIQTSGAVTIYLPAISALSGTNAEKVNITNNSAQAATIYPNAADTIGSGGTGVSVSGPTGVGASIVLGANTKGGCWNKLVTT